jgi:hypothetical protein
MSNGVVSVAGHASRKGGELPMPETLEIAAAIVTVVAGVVAVAEVAWRIWRRVSQKHKER